MSKATELKAKNENLFERNTILLNENERLKKENAELKEQLDAIDKAGEHVRQQINDAFRNKKPYWELEKENAELKEKFENLQKYLDTQNSYRECAETWQKLAQAKEIIKTMLIYQEGLSSLGDLKQKAEQFLKKVK